MLTASLHSERVLAVRKKKKMQGKDKQKEKTEERPYNLLR